MPSDSYQGVILDTHLYEMFSVPVSPSPLVLITPSNHQDRETKGLMRNISKVRVATLAISLVRLSGSLLVNGLLHPMIAPNISMVVVWARVTKALFLGPVGSAAVED